MPTLLEKIQQSLDQAVPTSGAGMQNQGQSQKIARMMAARSGKAGGAPVPMSNIGEQSANTETQQQLDQVRQNVEALKSGAADTIGQQTTEADRAQAGVNLQRDAQQQKMSQQTQQLLQEFNQSKGQLDQQKDQAKLEQLASNLALKDRKYLDNLQREGKRRRLDNALRFKQELVSSLMGENEQILRKFLGNKSILEANDRDFQRALGRMELDDILSMAKAEAKAAKTQALYSGISTMAGAAASAYKPGTPDTPSTTGSGGSGNTIKPSASN